MARYDHGYEVDETQQCVATTVRGRQCKNPPLVDKKLCALHGGEAAKMERRRMDAWLSSLTSDDNNQTP